ncbi:MAG: hypothetical protein PHE56_14275 [Bacteroidales bacterium]|nr:hypothetical protein [Bacteroidales bacterium]
MKKLIVLFFLFVGLISFSQETIKVMTYNLMYFNNYTTFCTSANNSHVSKAGWLKTIVNNQQPDILAVCEVGTSPSATYTLNYILGNSMNVDGETKWAVTTTTGSYLVNGLFYDKNKFQFVGHTPIATSGLRDLNIYKLKYTEYSEDIFFNVVVCHLAAGSSSADASDRGLQIQSLMTYLQNVGNNENYIVVGDFNVYTDEEQAFQKLVNPAFSPIAFYDPINQLGDWNSNYAYRLYHTQSTHDDSDSDCHSYGGMDDRFDFILIAGSIKDGTANVEYKQDSYWAVGQDGLHYNKSINSPTNSTLPAEVIDALYNMSDHLPVVAEFYMGDQNSNISLSTDPFFYANVANPISEEIKYQLKTVYRKEIKVSLISITGAIVFEDVIISEPGQIYSHNVSGLKDGMYILNFSGEGINQSVRLVKASQE